MVFEIKERRVKKKYTRQNVDRLQINLYLKRKIYYKMKKNEISFVAVVWRSLLFQLPRNVLCYFSVECSVLNL